MKIKSPINILFSALMLALIFQSCSNDQIDIGNDAFRGKIVSYEVISSYTVAQIDSLIAADIPELEGAAAMHDINVYKVIYETIDAFGEATVASGALSIPDSEDALPLNSYQHGTTVRRTDVPSELSYEVVLGIIMAGVEGYVMCQPDYLGMGDSPGRHPYVHAKTAATATVDMMRASRNVCAELGTELNGEVFLFGYSQGGHSTMAAFKEIETYHTDEFTLTAVAPMSGPYDLGGAQTDMILLDDPYASPFYLPYLLFGYNDIYNIYENYSDYIKEPWATTLPPMFNGEFGAGEINAVMPDVPKNIIKDDVLDGFANNADHPLRVALEENSLIEWTPQAPMRIYYCTGDDQVAYRNALNAYNSFIARGATDVQIFNGEDITGTTEDHGGCVVPVMLLARIWFDSMRN